MYVKYMPKISKGKILKLSLVSKSAAFNVWTSQVKNFQKKAQMGRGERVRGRTYRLQGIFSVSVEDLQTLGHIFRALTRPYKGRLTTSSQLKLAEYFPNWVFPKFLNPIKLKNKYYWFFVHTRSYKLQFDYDNLLITIYCIKIAKTTLVI